MTRRFGTDGIRGVAGVDLTADLALDVGRAVAAAAAGGLLGGEPHSARPRVVIGRDTRPSGDMLEAALTAGLTGAGADVLRAGVLPTPGVAYLIASLGADAGVVVSASHNPPADNGIKVFGSGGWKLTQTAEDALEETIGLPFEAAREPGGVEAIPDAEARYVDHLVASASRRLTGVKVVVDCAYGAAWSVAPVALRRLGAEVTALYASPDGERINEGCGATRPEVVAAAATQAGAIGLALDGDADRVLAVDEAGNVVDGDAILAILAAAMRSSGALPGGGIAVTVMSNQALRTWCAEQRIEIVETSVGDRYVLEAMRERGLALGGEQSGHVIRLDHATTGDGVLTSIGILEAVASSGGRLEDVVPFRPLPQCLLGVRVRDRAGASQSEDVRAAIRDAEARLGSRGRVLVRASGTEPVVRVMVEAPTPDEASAVAALIAAVVQREVGA